MNWASRLHKADDFVTGFVGFLQNEANIAIFYYHTGVRLLQLLVLYMCLHILFIVQVE